MHIVATGTESGIIKDLFVEDLTLYLFNWDFNIIEGTGRPDMKVLVGAGFPPSDPPEEPIYVEDFVEVGDNGIWRIETLGLLDGMYPMVMFFEDDGDGTMAEGECPYSITYNGDNLVHYPGLVTLSAIIEEKPGGNPGGILPPEQIMFELYSENNEYVRYATVVDGTAEIAVEDVPVGIYEAVATVVCPYWMKKDKDIALLAVSDGFVTGGGWFKPGDSSDKVSFGFELKYKNDGTLKGNLEMIDHSSGTNYKATDFDWLVVVENKAFFYGYMQENEEEPYPFMATMIDNGSPGKDKDIFKIDICIDGDQIPLFGEFGVLIDNGNIVAHN